MCLYLLGLTFTSPILIKIFPKKEGDEVHSIEKHGCPEVTSAYARIDQFSTFLFFELIVYVRNFLHQGLGGFCEEKKYYMEEKAQLRNTLDYIINISSHLIEKNKQKIKILTANRKKVMKELSPPRYEYLRRL